MLLQEGLIPALLTSTHETPGTYFASVSPFGNTGAMKYTHFCVPQGNQRDCFHFSHFLLAGLGNNEKTPRSRAGISAPVTPFVQSHKAVGFLLSSWLCLRGISTTGPGWRDSYTSPRCRLFASALCSPLPSAAGRSSHTRQLERGPRPQEEMTNPRHWELSAQNPHAHRVIQQSDRKEFVWHCPLLISGVESMIYPSPPGSLQLFFL